LFDLSAGCSVITPLGRTHRGLSRQGRYGFKSPPQEPGKGTSYLAVKAAQDLFERGIDYWENHSRNFTVTVSMYEIYGGKLYDLLNDH
jgi:hypothetical protein